MVYGLVWIMVLVWFMVWYSSWYGLWFSKVNGFKSSDGLWYGFKKLNNCNSLSCPAKTRGTKTQMDVRQRRFVTIGPRTVWYSLFLPQSWAIFDNT